MESPIQRKLSQIKQPQFEKICQRLLKLRYVAPLIAAIPGFDVSLLPYAEAAARVADVAKEALDDREKDRSDRNLSEVAAVVSTLQRAASNTYVHVINTIDFDAFRVLQLIESTRETRDFWRTAEERLDRNSSELSLAIGKLVSVGLVTQDFIFEHTDGTWRNYPDVGQAMKYAERLVSNLRRIMDFMDSRVRYDFFKQAGHGARLASIGASDNPPQPQGLDDPVRVDPWHLMGAPRLTLSGFYFLELVAIEAEAMNTPIDEVV